MFRRIAHLFGFRKKDEALEKRFAQIKAKYVEASEQTAENALGRVRITGNFDKCVVNGVQTATKERITQEFLNSAARAVDSRESDLAGTAK